MLRLIIVLALLHIASVTSSEDMYDDDPFLYIEPQSSKHTSRNSDSTLYRSIRNGVVPLMDDLEMEFDDIDEFARPTRAHDKNDNFVRFGRGNSDFVRFRKDPFKRYGGSNFIRFGRSVSEPGKPKKRSRRDTDDSKGKRERDNFLRFGRAGDDSFIRYGRDPKKAEELLPVPTKSRPSHFFRGQSYPYIINSRLAHNLPLLNILRKLEEEMRASN